MEIVFLGISDVGMRIYEWLCDRTSTDVRALLTEQPQLDQIQTIQPDIVVSVGFDHIVPPEITAIPEHGCINLHGGYLPYNRRRNTNVWPIIDGTPAGVTLHYMSEELDKGAIIAQREVPVTFLDTAKDVYHRLEAANYELFVGVWPTIETGDVTTKQQPDEGTSHTRAEFRELCRIDPEETYRARDLVDLLRATTFPPFDNACMEIDRERYYLDIDVRTANADTETDTASVGMVREY